ncbi:MAG: hypothetical protein M1140_07090 [Chloroflexi bacterium]|nr:hypothetical protein [Chloroflexota bacterium]
MPPVTTTLKNKVLMLCRDAFSGIRNYGMIPPYSGTEMQDRFWREIHDALTYKLGRPTLIPEYPSKSRKEDVLNFLTSCGDEEFLDFIELIFKTEIVGFVCADENRLVDDINELLRSENVGYELTHIVKKRITLDSSNQATEPIGYAIPGQQYQVDDVVAYPQIILKEDMVVHTEILKPVLNLLADVRFANANKEYLEALEDYRKGDYGDCLTKCCSALESVMKIICTQKKWEYKPTDSANRLISAVVAGAKLETYFENFLTTVPTLRNRLSKAHGAGIESKHVPQDIARYALNESASAIIFLVDATK